MSINQYTKVLQNLNKINLFRPGRLDLANMKNMTQLLGNPQNNLKFIHVGIHLCEQQAGTNGKGSTTLKIQKILQHQGYKTGIYTSPHLFSFKERIIVDDSHIDEQFIIEELQKLYQIAENHQIPLTFFEYITCLAFLYYDSQKVDFVALETGLGGRLDATNIITTSILSVITSIALDHTSILGNTVEQIAYEKAGIIKPNIPVVIGFNAKPYQVFIDEARKNESRIYIVDEQEEIKDFNTENNMITIEAIRVLQKHHNIQINQQAIQEGLNATQLCRAQRIIHSMNPQCQVILDVGHNPNALTRLFQSLNLEPKDLVVMYGTSAQKDASTSLKIIAQNSSSIYLISAQHFRAMPIEALIDHCQNLEPQIAKQIQTIEHGSIQETLKFIMNKCESKQTLVICGSFFIMREAQQALGQQFECDPFELNERLDVIK